MGDTRMEEDRCGAFRDSLFDIESLLISDTSPESTAIRTVYDFALEELTSLVYGERNVRTNADDEGIASPSAALLVKRDPELPMTLPVPRENFFIRACYPVYYNLLMQCLTHGKYDFVSVTGTPGIGKSVFYVYVFDRYRRENPKDTIITASFDKDNMLIECVVYGPDGEEPNHCDALPILQEGGLYLFDGPPCRNPLGKKMVCFTSPNLRWFRKNNLNRRHTSLYMPVWTLDELIDADSACGFGIGSDSISERYNFFGGCPRYCLTDYTIEVIHAEKTLAGKLSSIDSYEKLGLWLRDSTPDDQITHQVFHSQPVISKTFPFVHFRSRQVCSWKARELIYHAIKDKSDHARAELIRSIRLVPELASLRGVMFEDFCGLQFPKGGSFILHSLDAAAVSRNLTIPPHAYRAMKAGCESIDGSAFIDDTVYLFQITVGKNHPVNANGILERLKSLELFEKFCNDSIKVELVFVLPRHNQSFGRQKIVVPRQVGWGSRVQEMGMREEFVVDLVRQGYRTVDDVRIGLRNKALSPDRYGHYVRAFESRIINSSYAHKTITIPQSILVVEEFENPPDIRVVEMDRLRTENENLRKRLQYLESRMARLDDLIGGA